VINLATAFLAAWVVGLFESSIHKVSVLAVFMPIVAGMGGNGGTQTLTVITRGIALGEIDRDAGLRALVREVIIGTSIGIVTGLLTAVGAYLWRGSAMLGGVLLLAMIANMVVAGLSGAAIPLLLRAVRQDPALGSGVIVTTFTDVFGFLSFLGLATLLLRYLD
jgi:magnesium transporter